ncbi:MAG: DNA polymerase, partial [Patescibacteria group bacterium]
RDILTAFGVPIYEMPGFEADDIIGTIATSAKKNFNIIIASGDMDTMQLVDDDIVRVFTLRKGIQDTILYDEKAVLARYGFLPERIPDYKGFAGDPSDNIIGIPGVGEKTATKLLQTFNSMEGVYKAVHSKQWTVDRWKEAGFSERNLNLLKEHEDEAEFSKVLATIRTDAPINFIEPEKSFLEILDIERITSTFTDLGFRSLVSRARSLKKGGDSVAMGSESVAKVAKPEPKTLHAADAKLFAESAIMLWLTESDLTNPSVDDVLSHTKSETIMEAHTKLRARIEKEELLQVFETIEKPLIPVIEKINQHGVLIDKKYLSDLSLEYHTELDALAKKIHTEAGEDFNINSPKQLGEILFTKLGIGIAGKRQKKTATGQLSTKESELVKLKGEHPIIEHILSHRELQKLLSTYIDAIPPLLDSESRLHTSFIQTGTTTGRISSQNPNLQNIPVKSELGRRIRGAFIAPEGSVLAAFDYSQIELRLAALLSEDEKLIDIFKRGEDVHAAVAAEVYGVPQAEVTYDMRRKAKVINFGILYGMGVNALRENLGGDRAEAQEFYTRYFETFTGLAEYLTRTRATAARLGYTTTYFGRRRFFPGIRSKIPYVRAMAERMAINAPLQGTQSDIIKIAMTKINTVLEEKFGSDAVIVLQIHDELVFEIKKPLLEVAAKEIRHAMETVIPEDEMKGIPILVSSSAGPNWGDLKKI